MSKLFFIFITLFYSAYDHSHLQSGKLLYEYCYTDAGFAGSDGIDHAAGGGGPLGTDLCPGGWMTCVHMSGNHTYHGSSFMGDRATVEASVVAEVNSIGAPFAVPVASFCTSANATI